MEENKYLIEMRDLQLRLIQLRKEMQYESDMAVIPHKVDELLEVMDRILELDREHKEQILIELTERIKRA